MRNNKKSYTFIAGRPFCDTLLNFAWVVGVIGTLVALLSHFATDHPITPYTFYSGLYLVGMALTTFWFAREFARLDEDDPRSNTRAM